MAADRTLRNHPESNEDVVHGVNRRMNGIRMIRRSQIIINCYNVIRIKVNY